MLTILAASIAVVLAAALLPLFGLRRLALVALVLSLVLVPYPLLNVDVQPEHFGITGGVYVPHTYSVAVALCLVLFFKERGVALWATISAGIGLYLSLLLIFIWGNTAAQIAGVAHLVTRLAAFAVGIALGALLIRDLGLAKVWVWALLACFALQLLVMAAQLFGIPLGLYDTTTYFVNEGRPIGTFIHPSVLGKIAILALPSLFVLTRVRRDRLTLLSWITIGLALVTTILTQSRSNTAAVLGSVVVWLLLDFRLRAKQRWTLLGATGVLSIPAAALLLPRIISDPDGGDRPILLATALRELPEYLGYGLGANSYSSVIGQFDPLAATGLPVHNTFLHTLAEIGVVGAVLVFLPLAATVILAIRAFRGEWPGTDASRALLAVLPGVLVIYLTGWGLLLQGVFVFWFLTFGVSYGMMTYKGQALSFSDADGQTQKRSNLTSKSS